MRLSKRNEVKTRIVMLFAAVARNGMRPPVWSQPTTPSLAAPAAVCGMAGGVQCGGEHPSGPAPREFLASYLRPWGGG
jgi:hypothetical protein